jgi:hypothetical protein
MSCLILPEKSVLDPYAGLHLGPDFLDSGSRLFEFIVSAWPRWIDHDLFFGAQGDVLEQFQPSFSVSIPPVPW